MLIAGTIGLKNKEVVDKNAASGNVIRQKVIIDR